MILRLLRKKGVLSEGEYRQALAEVPNVVRLQRKVDNTIQKQEVFEPMTSATAPAPVVEEKNESTGESPPTEEQEAPAETPPPAGTDAEQPVKE